MSPEQIQDSKRVDVRSDIYSMGVALYQMSTGQLPFSGGAENILYKQLYERPSSPSSLIPGFSPQLESIILCCMKKAPEARFQNCEELIFALSSALSGGDDSGLQVTSNVSGPKLSNDLRRDETSPYQNQESFQIPSLPTAAPNIGKSFQEVARDKRASNSEQSLGSIVNRKATPNQPQRGWIWLSVFVIVVAGFGLGWWKHSSSHKNATNGSSHSTDGGPKNSASRKNHGGNSIMPSTQKRKKKLIAPKKQTCQTGQRRPCYSGPSTTLGKGICKAGTQICKNGKFGRCFGEIKPAHSEQCNGQDDNCNGKIDESFSSKGKRCTRRLGACVFRGRWRCHPNQKRLQCQRTKQLKRKNAVAIRLRLRPKGLPVQIKFNNRRSTVRNFACLEVSRRSSISLSAKGYQLCQFILPRRASVLSLRLKLKSDLEEAPGYCKQ